MATFTTPLTLQEANRAGELSQVDAALIETFLPSKTQRPDQMANFFNVFPWLDMAGVLSYQYTRELGLPTVTPRALNETITRSVGSTEQVKEALKIYSHEFIVDEVLLRTSAGAAARATQASMAAKAVLQTIQNHIFKGDESSSANQLTGLQARITGDQLVSEGSTSGGDPLQISNLRDSIDRCYGDGPKVIVCGKGLARRLDAAVGLAGVGAAIRSEQTAWGMKAQTFDGVPIIPVADFSGGDTILDFSEAGAGGGTTATSLYVLCLGNSDVHGLRSGDMWGGDVKSSSEPGDVSRVTFQPGLAIKRATSAVRHYGISDAAVIA